MCVKFPHKNLNHDPCPPHPTNTYTCGMIIALRMCGSSRNLIPQQPGAPVFNSSNYYVKV